MAVCPLSLLLLRLGKLGIISLDGQKTILPSALTSMVGELKPGKVK